MEYLYLVREREFAEKNEDVYKIGKTKQEVAKRMQGYPKDSELYVTICVDSCDIRERELINLFKDKYNLRDDIGAEYFQGDAKSMIQDLLTLAMRDWTSSAVSSTSPTKSKTYVLLKQCKDMMREIKSQIEISRIFDQMFKFKWETRIGTPDNAKKQIERNLCDHILDSSVLSYCDSVDRYNIERVYQWTYEFKSNFTMIKRIVVPYGGQPMHLEILKKKCMEFIRFADKNSISEVARNNHGIQV
jgi:hypothetical protein